MYLRFCLYLLSALTVTILAAGVLSYGLMTRNARAAAEKELSSVLEEVNTQYKEAALKVNELVDLNNNSLLASARCVAEIIRLQPGVLDDQEALQKLCNENFSDCLIVCDEKGVVRISTPDNLAGQALGEDYTALLECVNSPAAEGTLLINTGQPTRFAAVRRRDAPGTVILSFILEYEQNARDKGSLANLITEMSVGENGYLIAFAEGVQVNQSILPTSEAELRSLPLNELIEQRFNDEDFFLYATINKGLRLIGVIPTSEFYANRTSRLMLQLYTAIALSLILLPVLYRLLKHYVLSDIDKLNVAMKRISAGNIDAKVKESKSPEFQQLTMNINEMLDSLRSRDDRISEHARRDIELAKAIKESTLPKPERLFAGRNDFSMVATVVQPDSVGGDFYDCLMPDDKHLLFMLSSINEQGVPAALYMMYWLAILRSYTNKTVTPSEIAGKVNRSICRGGDSRVQVSMFIGLLEIATGKVECVNAGLHTPLHRAHDGGFCELDIPVLPPFGVDAKTEYAPSTFTLEPGDRLFLCTNGLVCMENEANEFYGEARLHAALGEDAPALRDIPHLVRGSLRRFIGSKKRVNDCSMLCLEITGVQRSGGCVSVPPHDTETATDMIRNKLEEVFAAPSDIELLINATTTVMAAISHAPTVQVSLGCTENHARITLTYTGPEKNVLHDIPHLPLDSASYRHLDNVNDIILYKAIE